jgi:hypothetical protein
MPNESTIFRVCSYLRNWFDNTQTKYAGEIVIENGALQQTYNIKFGQYFRIVGSSLNDGVYKYPITVLNDETFNGLIAPMAIPASVLEIMDKIEAWVTKYADVNGVNMSPFNSESFGGYSYSKSAGGAGDSTQSKAGTWQGTFGAELQPWRKM